jgi:hypothetical protein
LRRVFTINGSADSVVPPAHVVSAEQLPADYLPKAASGKQQDFSPPPEFRASQISAPRQEQASKLGTFPNTTTH